MEPNSMRCHPLAATLVLALVASSCGSASFTTAATTGSTAEEAGNDGGFGAPSQAAGEFDPIQSAYSVTGSLRLDDVGCWSVVLNEVERLVALPIGFTIDGSDATALVSPDGSTIRDGDAIDGSARFFQATDVPGGPDGRWGNYINFCKPSLAELAVFDEVTAAFDPAGLTTADQRALISSAAFTEHWPCGRGWATSTSDQRVGVIIYQLDDQLPTPGEPIILPDDSWVAEVIVGSFLFVNHCNDAIEEWMPEQNIVARLPITGVVTIHDAVPAPSDEPSRVTATLDEAVIEIDGDRLELPQIELRNDGYNFFAG